MKSLKALSDIDPNDDLSLSQDPLDCPYFEENSSFYWQLSEHVPQEINNPMNENGQKVQEQEQERPQYELMQEKSDVNSTEQISKKVQSYRNNRRRKLDERKIMGKLISFASQFSTKPTKKIVKTNYSKVTKNLLTFAKKPHLDFIAKSLGNKFINNIPFLQSIKKKKSINLEDYQKMYECQVLQKVLEQFFRQKYLYRYLMTSRTTFEDKIYHSYFLDVFERNFSKKQFKGISHTKLQIELERLK